MDRTERFQKMLRLIREKKCVSRQQFIDDLEVSPATFKRDLEYMRSRLEVPIDWDRERNCYLINEEALARGLGEIPGLWFTADEAHALLSMYHLLAKLEPGFLESQVGPLKDRLEKLIATKPGTSREVMRRIRVLSMGSRAVTPKYFSVIARALLERRQVKVTHYSRERDETTERALSPQRLTHYRDNWYLDAWCHWRKAIRCFALDAIRSVEPLDERAKEIADADLDRELASSYGIFSGQPTATARLRFSEARSRWVSRETWHPDQKASWDGTRYVLEVPYRDDRELLGDILRHGAEVEVLAPAALRARHRDALQKAFAQYPAR